MNGVQSVWARKCFGARLPAVVQASFFHLKKRATWVQWVSTAHLYAQHFGCLLLSALAAKHAEPATYDVSVSDHSRQYSVFSPRSTGNQARSALFAYLTHTMHDALLHIF